MTPPGPSISGRRHRWFQLIPVPATPYAEILGLGAGRRTLAISLALLITRGLLLLLLTFGLGKPADNRDERITVVTLVSAGDWATSSEPGGPNRERAKEQRVPTKRAGEGPPRGSPTHTPTTRQNTAPKHPP